MPTVFIGVRVAFREKFFFFFLAETRNSHRYRQRGKQQAKESRHNGCIYALFDKDISFWMLFTLMILESRERENYNPTP